MAALLCTSIGQLISSVASVCTVPCRGLCAGLGAVCCSPFAPYLALTLALNVPPTVWGVQQFTNTDCTWAWINAIGTALHIVAAFYIVHQIQTDQLPEQEEENGETANATTTSITEATKTVEEGTTHYQKMETPGGSTMSYFSYFYTSDDGTGQANSIQRLGQVLCYDVGVAIYIVVFVLWSIWQSVGLSRVLFTDDTEDSCQQVMVRSIVCGFLYLALVCLFFACSLFCLR